MKDYYFLGSLAAEGGGDRCIPSKQLTCTFVHTSLAIKVTTVRCEKMFFLLNNSAHTFMQVLHRKTEEAAAATKRLKELLEARKSSKENTTNGISEA